ncbi:MAG TPA: HAD family phosphatase [Albitalea sp.]|uniref:HAD family hydrolase n=1 Tax=Piscinibacter sp. TaxID=1903157 RepID=UPI002ED6405C
MTTSALLFDLDGTLIDSMPHHNTAWEEWHRRRDLPFDGDAFFAATAGRANAEIMRTLVPGRTAEDYTAMADEKETLYREIATRSLELIPGFEALRAVARAGGMKLAICTASTPENMALAFERFGLDSHMDTVVSPADGMRGKPHPDIFLEAARRLGVPPAECIVFEDAPLGIEAARRAGMPAVALTTTLPAEEFQAFDNVLTIVPDFSSLELAALDRAAHKKETRHA